MRNRIILILIFTFLFFDVIGQARVSREKIQFTKESDKLETSTGWGYNESFAEWVDYENLISSNKDYKEKYKILLNQFTAKTYQNFISIQTKVVNVNNLDYYIIVVTKLDGHYKYPNLKQDWSTYKRYDGYIFSAEEYSKMKNIDTVIELVTKKSVYQIIKYDEREFLDLIHTEILKEENSYDRNITFPIMKSAEGAIRFYVPKSFSSYFGYDFEKEYFETDTANFSRLIIK